MYAAEILWYIGNMEIRLSGHSAYGTEYQIIWIPEYRRRVLNPGVRGYLVKVFPKVLRSMSGCEILERNIQVDHIHLLMVILPKYAVSDLAGRIKGKTSSQLRKKSDWLKKVDWKENIIWSPGYFVSTVGIDEDKIREYVRNQ